MALKPSSHHLTQHMHFSMLLVPVLPQQKTPHMLLRETHTLLEDVSARISILQKVQGTDCLRQDYPGTRGSSFCPYSQNFIQIQHVKGNCTASTFEGYKSVEVLVKLLSNAFHRLQELYHLFNSAFDYFILRQLKAPTELNQILQFHKRLNNCEIDIQGIENKLQRKACLCSGDKPKVRRMLCVSTLLQSGINATQMVQRQPKFSP